MHSPGPSISSPDWPNAGPATGVSARLRLTRRTLGVFRPLPPQGTLSPPPVLSWALPQRERGHLPGEPELLCVLGGSLWHGEGSPQGPRRTICSPALDASCAEIPPRPPRFTRVWRGVTTETAEDAEGLRMISMAPRLARGDQELFVVRARVPSCQWSGRELGNLPGKPELLCVLRGSLAWRGVTAKAAKGSAACWRSMPRALSVGLTKWLQHHQFL